MTELTGREKSELRREIVISDKAVCHFCKTEGLKGTDKFCPNCGFPQNGTQIEMRRYYWNLKNKKELIEKKKSAVKRARIILYILAGINLAFGFGYYFIYVPDMNFLIGSIIGAVIYFVLGLWSIKQPFAAILSGLLVYLTFVALNAVADPHTIYQGIIWKVLIITGFIYGFKGAKEAKSLQSDLDLIKKAVSLDLDPETIDQQENNENLSAV